MNSYEKEFTELGATKTIVKNTVARIEFRKKDITNEITISLSGVMCKNKETGECAIIPLKYIDPIIDVIHHFIENKGLK